MALPPRNVGHECSWVWVLFRTTQASRLSIVCVWGGGFFFYYVLRVLESFLTGFALGLPYPLYPLNPPAPSVFFLLLHFSSSALMVLVNPCWADGEDGQGGGKGVGCSVFLI